jgi:hypothetical protein
VGGKEMNLTIEQIVSIISAVGISTIVSAIIAFVQNNKKNNLDFVTKERSEWRKKLKEILSELSDKSKKESAIIKLKSEINPYGRNMKLKDIKPYYMKEGHIWDLLDSVEEVDFDRLAFYIELLLKFDWERSKSEVKFKPTNAINRVLNFLLFFSSLYCIYHIISVISVTIQTGVTDIPYIINATISIVAYILILVQPSITDTIISNPPKKQKMLIWIFILFYAFPFVYIIYNLIYIFELNPSFYFISLILIFAYEIFYLYQLYIYEDTYVKEIERYLESKSKKSQ